MFQRINKSSIYPFAEAFGYFSIWSALRFLQNPFQPPLQKAIHKLIVPFLSSFDLKMTNSPAMIAPERVTKTVKRKSIPCDKVL
jgi:hypothetical protein